MIPEKSMSMRPMLHFICYKMFFFFLSEAMSYGILWGWIWHSVSPQMVVLAETLRGGKAKPYPAYICLFQWEQKAAPSMMEVIQYNELLPGGWLVPSGNGATLGARCWYLLLAGWELSNGSSQIGLDEWKNILLSPYIRSISPYMVIVFMSQLGIK